MSVRRFWRARRKRDPHTRETNVGQKTLFEGWAERGWDGLKRGWWITAKITHFQLHATKGYRRLGSQKLEKFVLDKPKTWLQGYNRAEILRFGLNLRILSPEDVALALPVS
jgi:hypothetical protein